MHELADPLQVCIRFFGLHVIDILPGMSLHIGRKACRIAFLIALVQRALDPLQHFHQQLHPPDPANVAGNLCTVHALQLRLYLESHDLLIRHLLKGLIQQVHSLLLHVAAQPFTKVVQRAQIKIAFSKFVIA
jgi:hypothetical protein